ncbi:hypothetical protein [Frankia tisae]|uniref:hypothetical protein n=1 Tax=Frankia tisae TaxID=2950104 RepID=UPI0021C177B4|nr:hypothetical protein [Frankia tisae]
MERGDSLRWLVSNADSLVTLLLAIFVAVVGMGGFFPPDFINSAIALTLAALASMMLNDRLRREGLEREVRDIGQALSPVLGSLANNLEQIGRLDVALNQTMQVIDNHDTVRVVSGEEISSRLADSRRHTTLWRFKGATGTFSRVVTLPECVEIARRERKPLEFMLEVIDPTDLKLCREYVESQRAWSDSGEERGWTAKETSKDVFATILTASWYKNRYPQYDIGIALSSTFTLFRWDLSSQSLVITQRGPLFPAMEISSGKFSYRWWSIELQASFRQARQLNLTRENISHLSDEPTIAQTRRLFDNLELALPPSITDHDIEDIIRRALHDRNPYE